MTPTELWHLVRVGKPAVARDGSFGVVPATGFDLETDEKKTLLFAVDAGGSEPALLTNPDLGSATDPTIDRSGQRLAFVRPPPGEDAAQVHVTDLGVGEPLAVTDLPLGARDPRFAGDGRYLVCVGDLLVDHPTVLTTRAALESDVGRRPPRVTEKRIYRFWDHWLAGGVVPHLFVVDLATLEVRDLMPGWTRTMHLMEERGRYDVSPDGELVAFEADATTDEHAPLRNGIYTVPLTGGEITLLTKDHPGSDSRPRFTSDGEHLLFGMKVRPDYYADRVRLVRRSLSDGREVVLTKDWDRSVAQFEAATDGSIWLTADDDARTHLYRLRGADEPERIAEGGAFGAPQPAGEGVWVTRSDLLSPPEVFRIDPGGASDPVTRFNTELLGHLDAPEISEHRVEAAPGEEVQAFVLLPPGHDGRQPLPLVHMIHGGPHSFFGDAFHFRWSARVFASWGFAVALVNFHGSESFGTTYRESILGAWGDKPARDVLAVTDHLVDAGIVDPERMAISGGSFGGYLTAWLATQTDRFKCGVCHAGVFDLKAMLGSDVIDWLHVAYGAAPWGDEPRVRDNDPSSHAEAINTPMLVLHGERDFRVPYTQGLALYNTLKRRGVEARLVLFEDENHWILKPRASLDWYGEVESWLRRWLC